MPYSVTGVGRPVGSAGVSEKERELRAFVSRRLRELLGPKPVAELARRLGDKSRTRAHKLLNPDQKGSYGQSITLALIEVLALAFKMSPTEFLAPRWLAENAEEELAQARQRRQDEVMARQDALLKEELDALARPQVAALLRLVSQGARHMQDPELDYERERWAAFYQYKFDKSREGLFGAPPHGWREHPLEPEDVEAKTRDRAKFEAAISSGAEAEALAEQLRQARQNQSGGD